MANYSCKNFPLRPTGKPNYIRYRQTNRRTDDKRQLTPIARLLPKYGWLKNEPNGKSFVKYAIQ